MRFIVEKEILLKSLSRVQSVVEKRNTIPILSNILISANGDSVYLTATDLEVASKIHFNSEVQADGDITVNAKKFFEIIKELPEGEISIISKDNCWIEIRSGKSVFNIVGLSSDEFPFFPDFKQASFFSISGSTLKKLIDKTILSTSNDESKYNLNGIYVKLVSEEDKEYLRFVATDGHRLSLANSLLSESVEGALSSGVILPKKGLLELKKISEENETISLGFFDNNAVVRTESSTLVMRLIDGDFPDYERVIPKCVEQSMVVSKNLFVHALKRISILSSDGSRGVKIHLSPDSMEISSSNPEYGEAKEQVDIKYDGDEVSVGFNARFLIDILNVIDSDQVSLAIKDQLSPGVLTPHNDTDFLAVVMPMRL